MQRPDWRPRSLLDVGAGPGVAAWAALEVWPSLTELTLIEVEPEMLAAGRELLPDATLGRRRRRRRHAGPADLVVASYVLGELPDPRRRGAPLAAERGHAGADRAGDARGLPPDPRRPDTVIGAGGHTVAPCPHDLAARWRLDDWCHFAVRLPRSKLHRHAKGAELGYEDEKFSYAVLAREPVPRADARIIRQPQIRSGHVNLVTCERDGVHDRTISRKQGDRYREAKRAAWGDAIAPPPAPRP